MATRRQIDEEEANLSKLVKDLNKGSYIYNLDNDRIIRAATKLARYGQFIKLKESYQKLIGEGVFKQVVFYKDNKERSERFFNQKIVSYEGLGQEIKSYEDDIKWLNDLRNDDKSGLYQYDQKQKIEEIVERTEQIEKKRESINELKEREKDLADPSVRKDTQVLNFTKGGYNIQCTLKDDKTRQILYSKKEISGNEVMQTLLNNGDDGVTWENVDDLSNPYSMRYVYHSSDHKLEAIFMKINDSMGILIRERSAPEKPARREAEGLPQKKEEKGL